MTKWKDLGWCCAGASQVPACCAGIWYQRARLNPNYSESNLASCQCIWEGNKWPKHWCTCHPIKRLGWKFLMPVFSMAQNLSIVVIWRMNQKMENFLLSVSCWFCVTLLFKQIEGWFFFKWKNDKTYRTLGEQECRDNLTKKLEQGHRAKLPGHKPYC